jgi:hypothetical protein
MQDYFGREFGGPEITPTASPSDLIDQPQARTLEDALKALPAQPEAFS